MHALRGVGAAQETWAMRIEVELREGREKSSWVFEGDPCREEVADFLEALDLPSADNSKLVLEVDDGENMTTMNFRGGLCRERAVQSLKALKVSSEPQTQVEKQKQSSRGLSNEVPDEELTLKERLRLFLKFDYNEQWFNSSDAKKAYESQYGEEIGLSTVSTYLSRMAREGVLEKRGSRAEREYRVAEAPEGEELSETVEEAY